LGVTYAQRQALRLTTIGSTDVKTRARKDDEFSKLSAEDRAKLALLEQELERDGDMPRAASHQPAPHVEAVADMLLERAHEPTPEAVFVN